MHALVRCTGTPNRVHCGGVPSGASVHGRHGRLGRQTRPVALIIHTTPPSDGARVTRVPPARNLAVAASTDVNPPGGAVITYNRPCIWSTSCLPLAEVLRARARCTYALSRSNSTVPHTSCRVSLCQMIYKVQRHAEGPFLDSQHDAVRFGSGHWCKTASPKSRVSFEEVGVKGVVLHICAMGVPSYHAWPLARACGRA